MRDARTSLLLTMLAATVLTLAADPAAGLEIWSGRDYYFAKADFADWTLPENQDRITPTVWITRQNDHGIFNIAQESVYEPSVSPRDTEWATGDAANWENLTFQPWKDWAGSYPPGVLGADACVHLISDDIYIDIRMDSWTQGAQGGGFSYLRASGPTPAETGTWGDVKALFR